MIVRVAQSPRFVITTRVAVIERSRKEQIIFCVREKPKRTYIVPLYKEPEIIDIFLL